MGEPVSPSVWEELARFLRQSREFFKVEDVLVSPRVTLLTQLRLKEPPLADGVRGEKSPLFVHSFSFYVLGTT